MREIMTPFSINFDGRDADLHRVDGLQLGQSLSGISRIYNSIGHLHFHQEFQSSEHSGVRCQVGPPKEGSLSYLFYLLFTHGRLATYPELYFEAAEIIIPAFFKAMIGKKTGQNELIERQMTLIEKQQHDYAKLAESSQESARETNGRLLDIVDHLVDRNGRAMNDMAAPVGKSVSQIEQRPNKSDPILIDPPTAEALRAPEELTVGELRTYHGRMTAIDKETGSFKFIETDSGARLVGKITDPAVRRPENVYTHAVDTDSPIEIVAKPTFKESGDLHKIFVSDGKNAE